MFRKIVLLLLFLWIQPITAQNTLAFPGAEGFGATASGGRGGQVIYVTTLANDGPGSLSEALNTPGPRYILFKVSGVIHTAAEIIYGDVTIAGQTSPSGITVRGIVCDGHYDANDCDNLIIRHIRSRPAVALNTDQAGYVLDDALRLDGVETVMIDHVSLANASDEAIQLSMARNITIQNTILGETLGEHYSLGGLLLNYSHSQRPQDNISIHHNLWYRIGGRLPEISCELTRNIGADDTAEQPSFCSQQPLNLELSNNLLYDAGGSITYNDNAFEGQGQPDAGIFVLNLNWVNNFMIVRPNYPFGMMGSSVLQQPGNRLYVAGNRLNLYPDYSDVQLVYCCNDFNLYHPNTDTPAAQMQDSRHNFPAITYTSTEDLPEYIVDHVGAFPRDTMDQRYLDAVAHLRFSDTPHDLAEADDAFAVMSASEPPLDTDLDGMPDEWELTHNLDPNLQDHNGTTLSDAGYTNLEVYLNELAEASQA